MIVFIEKLMQQKNKNKLNRNKKKKKTSELTKITSALFIRYKKSYGNIYTDAKQTKKVLFIRLGFQNLN